MTIAFARARVLVAAVLAMLLAGATWPLLQSPAAAAPAGIQISVAGGKFSATPTGRLIHASRLMPGSAVDGVMAVRSTSSRASSLSLQFVHVRSGENGCTHAERAMPGGCDPHGPGELGGALAFDIATASTSHGPYSSVWTGGLGDLRHGVRVGQNLAAHGTTWLRLTVELPISAGNEVQSDTLGFDVRVALSDPVLAAADAGGSGFGRFTAVSTVPGARGLGTLQSGGFSLLSVPGLLIIGAAVLVVLAGALVVLGIRERSTQRA